MTQSPDNPSSTSFATAPIHVLIGTPLHQLTVDQIRMLNLRARQLKASPPAIMKSIREEDGENNKPARKKSATLGEKKVNVNSVANLYV